MQELFDWSVEEAAVVRDGVGIHGKRWRLISAALLPHRGAGQIARFYAAAAGQEAPKPQSAPPAESMGLLEPPVAPVAAPVAPPVHPALHAANPTFVVTWDMAMASLELVRSTFPSLALQLGTAFCEYGSDVDLLYRLGLGQRPDDDGTEQDGGEDNHGNGEHQHMHGAPQAEEGGGLGLTGYTNLTLFATPETRDGFGSGLRSSPLLPHRPLMLHGRGSLGPLGRTLDTIPSLTQFAGFARDGLSRLPPPEASIGLGNLMLAPGRGLGASMVPGLSANTMDGLPSVTQFAGFTMDGFSNLPPGLASARPPVAMGSGAVTQQLLAPPPPPPPPLAPPVPPLQPNAHSQAPSASQQPAGSTAPPPLVHQRSLFSLAISVRVVFLPALCCPVPHCVLVPLAVQAADNQTPRVAAKRAEDIAAPSSSRVSGDASAASAPASQNTENHAPAAKKHKTGTRKWKRDEDKAIIQGVRAEGEAETTWCVVTNGGLLRFMLLTALFVGVLCRLKLSEQLNASHEDVKQRYSTLLALMNRTK